MPRPIPTAAGHRPVGHGGRGAALALLAPAVLTWLGVAAVADAVPHRLALLSLAAIVVALAAVAGRRWRLLLVLATANAVVVLVLAGLTAVERPGGGVLFSIVWLVAVGAFPVLAALTLRRE